MPEMLLADIADQFMTYLCLGSPILFLLGVVIYRIYRRNREVHVWEEFGPQSVSATDSIKNETMGTHRGRGFKIKIETLYELIADEELLLGGILNAIGGGKPAKEYNDNLTDPARRHREYRVIELQLRYMEPIRLWIRKSRQILGQRLDYGSEIKTGDNNFDRAFVIYGDPPHRLQNIFSSPELRKKLADMMSYQVTEQPTIIIDNRQIRYQTTARLDNAQKIKFILDVLCDLADASENL